MYYEIGHWGVSEALGDRSLWILAAHLASVRYNMPGGAIDTAQPSVAQIYFWRG